MSDCSFAKMSGETKYFRGNDFAPSAKVFAPLRKAIFVAVEVSMESHRLTSLGHRRNTKCKLSPEIPNQIALSVGQFENAPFRRIDEVGRFAFSCDHTARFLGRRD